jgi:hypothetical protein
MYQEVMNYWVVGNCRVNLSPLIINILHTVIAFPILSAEHQASFMDEVATAHQTYSLLLVLSNISPALFTAWYEVRVVLWRLLWNLVFGKSMTTCRFNENNLLSTVGTVLVEFPPSSSAFKTAELVFAI